MTRDDVRATALGAGIVSEIFRRHGVTDPWTPLPSTGLANVVFASRGVVLRVATDHPEAVPDARTESVAAPVAHAAGILTPRLLAFDDSRTLVDRPFSLWERVHGDPMATAGLAPSAAMSVWHDVGRELARLHRRVRRCEDPDEWLDSPARELDVEGRIGRLVETGRLSHAMAADVTRLFADLEPVLGGEPPPRFLHGDMHDGNVLCAGSGELKAIIDWGDAGWGDSALDFATIPTSMVPAALAGYRSDEAGSSNPPSLPRIVWGQLMTVLDNAWEIEEREVPLAVIRELLDQDT